MPKGTVLTPKVEEIIAEVWDQHPELRARPKKFHDLVYERVHKEINWAEPGWPGVGAIKRRLKQLRIREENRSAESKELDGPWSLSTLGRHRLSPEAVPTVLRIWCACKEVGESLTIREAQWIDRLFPIAKALADRVKDKGISEEQVTAYFLQRAAQMAQARERVAELVGTDMAPWPDFDLCMWARMMDTEVSRELVEAILPGYESRPAGGKGYPLRLTKKERARWQELWERLGYPGSVEEAAKRFVEEITSDGDSEKLDGGSQ